MVILQAIILGIIEGLTEFLPISSTGHLLVAEKAIGYHDTARIFTVVVQLGAIAAVMWYYRKDLLIRISGLFKRQRQDLIFWRNILIATIPAGVIGIAADNIFNDDMVGVVAAALIIGGLILLVAEKRLTKQKHTTNVDLDIITAKQAAGVGCAQVLALVPGVSRSGATIVGGMFAGLNRVSAAAFSFYLSMPIMVLASGYKLLKGRSNIADISGGGAALVLATVVAFVTALIAVSWLLGYISKNNFKPFAYYRIIFGLVLIVLLAVGYL